MENATFPHFFVYQKECPMMERASGERPPWKERSGERPDAFTEKSNSFRSQKFLDAPTGVFLRSEGSFLVLILILIFPFIILEMVGG